jgi:2-polyprenyl-3-methyl-5-hydroxy-6-metoxy-1,4-benzoquinol methylase
MKGLLQYIRQRGEIDATVRAAEVLVPLLIKTFHPKTVVDVGCGCGAFYHVFHNYSIETLGLDKSKGSLIPGKFFAPLDLDNNWQLINHYDLGLCLEVAEHIKPGRHADELVRILAQQCRVVIWSAAIPLQGGSHHINEQWPSYWAEKFLKYHYYPSDALRWKIWSNDAVVSWYRQNLLVFASMDTLSSCNLPITTPAQLNVVHPATWMEVSFSKLLKRLCQSHQ